MYFDEDMLLDIRLNVLNDYVDKFIIAEATRTHSGKEKKLNFDIKKFSKFKENEFFFDYLKKEIKEKRKMGHITTLI